MAYRRGVTSAMDGLIVTADEGVVCDMCHRDAEVATLTGVMDNVTEGGPGFEFMGNLCTHCAARLIEVVSGFRVPKVLDQMYLARDTARNIRLIGGD